jgi:hypothetical protein
MNNRVMTVSDSKTEAKLSYDLGVVQALRAIMGQKEYRFRLSKQTSLTAGVATIATNIATNLQFYNEGSALLALFDECKLNEMRVQALMTPASGFSQIVTLHGIEWVVSTTTPTATTISRLPNQSLLTTFDPRPVVLCAKPPRPRPWGETVDEGVSTPRIASGFNSTYRACEAVGTNTVTTSVTYYILNFEAVGLFRSRA